MAEPLYVVNPDIVRIGAATYWDAVRGSEIRLGSALSRLVTEFGVPSTVSAVSDSLRATDAESVRAAVAELLARGVLREHSPAAAAAGRAAGGAGGDGIFKCPVVSIGQALAGSSSDVVVFGVPYDVGVTYRPGTRFGPEYIRRVSGSIFQYREEAGKPVGMYDPVRDRFVLDGVRLADTGDIDAGSVLTRNGEAFEAVEALTGKIALAGRVPVLLGGDHSLSLPSILGVVSAYGEIGVIHIDAHCDYAAERTDDWRRDCHHGNFMSWIIGDKRVSRVAQFGIRQCTESPPFTPPKVVRWPGTVGARVPIEEIVAELPEDLPLHLTVDVDGLDPSVIPSTGTPLPGGFSHAELVGLLEGIADRRRVVAMDLVELMPDASEIPGQVAADLVLRVLDAATRSRPS